MQECVRFDRPAETPTRVFVNSRELKIAKQSVVGQKLYITTEV